MLVQQSSLRALHAAFTLMRSGVVALPQPLMITSVMLDLGQT